VVEDRCHLHSHDAWRRYEEALAAAAFAAETHPLADLTAYKLILIMVAGIASEITDGKSSD
jgi:hypothetical protein